MKKLICLVISLMCVLNTVSMTVFSETLVNNSVPDSVSGETEKTNDYGEYMNRFQEYPAATEAMTFFASGGLSVGQKTAISSDGAELNEIGDGVTWNVNVDENTLFQPMITYCPLPGNGSDIEMSLCIDGEVPYSQAEMFLLYRTWRNVSNDFSSNQNGDEFCPEQEEVFESRTSGVFDREGFVTAPLCIALSKGSHTLTVKTVGEPVRIELMKLVAPQVLPTYEEYAAGFPDAKDYNGEEIVIEGENAEFKSQKSFVPQAARNNADVSPADPYHKRMNYIGGPNWNAMGGTICWRIQVPQDGWYQLGFHYRQNYLQEGASYRKLMIDDVIPFEEAAELSFGYQNGWQYGLLSDKNRKELPVYLSAGQHTLSLTVTLGSLADFAAELQSITDTLGSLYRKIVRITGENPDANRDYELFDAIPELGERLPQIAEKLEQLATLSEAVSGAKGGSNAQILRKTAVTIRQMLQKKYEAHKKLSAYYDNYSSLCSWLYEMQNMALDIDTVLLTAPGKEFSTGKIGFLQKVLFSVQRLAATYSEDYMQRTSDKDAIVLWTNWGRDQITLLENLITNDFTPTTGINVKIKITATTLVQAGLAGNGPDFQLNVERTDPMNYAMRGLLYDLSQFEDFEEITRRFNKTATVPYRYKDGIYGLPSMETFNMLFVRTDIFEELALKIPMTWEDFINTSKIISLNNMECGMVSDVMMFMTQMDVPLYNDDYTATNLMSAESVKAYSFMTDFFTKYKFPVTFNFFNRFRTGLMPMAIAPYSENATLRAAAPEINGKWRMVEIPGFSDDDGILHNNVNGSGTACVILEWSNKKNDAWEFLKWWTSDEIQYRFSVNIESILGASGRYATANLNAVFRLGGDPYPVEALRSQFDKVIDLPEVPGSYYVSRATQQVFWNVVNNGQNVEDMLKKWVPEADDEIRRKTEEYAKVG